MTEITKSEIKQLAYKIPSILNITSILSNENIVKSNSHSKNIELLSSLFGYKTFASLNSVQHQNTKDLFSEKLNRFYGGLTQKQLKLFTEILYSLKSTSNNKHSQVVVCNGNNQSNDMWHHRLMEFKNALADQIIHISSNNHWMKNADYYFILFSKFDKLNALKMELDSICLLQPLIKSYIDRLPGDGLLRSEQHGFVVMQNICRSKQTEHLTMS